jgi:hypothetical protein
MFVLVSTACAIWVVSEDQTLKNHLQLDRMNRSLDEQPSRSLISNNKKGCCNANP